LPRWEPQPGPQARAIDARWCPDLFYGGARGGGKTDFLLGDFGQDVAIGEHWRGLLLRESYPELEEVIGRSKQIYPGWFPGAVYHETRKTWTFPGGAELKMRYIEREADADLYQGHQYTWIGCDELAKQKTLGAWRKLYGCLRSAHNVPFIRRRGTGNPGGPAHNEVKSYYISPAPMGYRPISDGPGKPSRMYIPSRVQDNAILMAADPGYIDRLKMVGSDELVRAWLEGDWDAIEGAFFDLRAEHTVEVGALPAHWLRYRAMDWGFASPFSVGWYAVSDGELPRFPRGALIKYREWYGCDEGTPNVGARLTAEEVADGIAERDGGENINVSVLDPSAFSEDGGPSIGERINAVLAKRKTGLFRRADNKRVSGSGAMGGWDQMRARLRGRGGVPMLYFDASCVHTIRTLAVLQHDESRPEDLDTDSEDHAADETRYACMARPFVVDLKPVSPPTFGYRASEGGIIKSDLTFNQLRDLHKRAAGGW